MTKVKQTKKYALVKRMINPKDSRLKNGKAIEEKKAEAKEKKEAVHHVQQVASSLFFKHNSSLGPPYHVIIDTNFINFSIQNKLELIKAMMDCLYAKSIPCITDCVMAELEKLGPKYRVALKVAKDPRFERLPCSHKGTYADDCIVNRVMQHKCYIVATCDRDLRRRIRKIPGVPIMHISQRRYMVERLPEAYGFFMDIAGLPLLSPSSFSAEKNLIIIDGLVFDVTAFAPMHPGGEKLLDDYKHKDATKEFFGLHKASVLLKYKKFCVGKVADDAGQIVSQSALPGELSNVPYAENSVWHGLPSPYYNDSHIAFKKAIRLFFDEVVIPEAEVYDAMDKVPSKELYKKAGEFGLLACRIGPGPWLKGRKLPGGVKPEEFDYFHELIAHEEMAAMGFPGFADGLACGMVIGLPPLLHFGTPELKKQLVPAILNGEKTICLSITEPFVGSDVANIRTTAKLSECKKFWIVNGVKKWITNGVFADYFVTAVRTGGKGMGGISMLLIDRAHGIETKKIKTSYSGSAGTAYVIMEDVKVPVGNLLGKVNQGFKCIMYNFNHERWLIVCQSIRGTRLAIEDAFKWANQREVFGESLLSSPVIRTKLAQMISSTEAIASLLEATTYQMCKLSYNEQSVKLAGRIALLKFISTRVATTVADESCQIFGGRSITQSGMGAAVERYHRAIKFASILGGSEEIMSDLGIRQAMKIFPKNARL